MCFTQRRRRNYASSSTETATPRLCASILSQRTEGLESMNFYLQPLKQGGEVEKRHLHAIIRELVFAEAHRCGQIVSLKAA